MSVELLAAKMADARAATRKESGRAKALEALADALANGLADAPREMSIPVARKVRARLVELELGDLDAGLIARIVAGVFAALQDLAKTDPDGADRIVKAIVAHCRAWKPEQVVPLDAGFAPTEAVPSRPPGAP